MTDTPTPEAPVTEAGLDHRHSWNGTVCGLCGLTRGRESRRNDDARIARKVREGLAKEVRALRQADALAATYPPADAWNRAVERVLALISGSTENGPPDSGSDCPHDHVTCDQCREGLTGTGIRLAATPSPAPTDREGEVAPDIEAWRQFTMDLAAGKVDTGRMLAREAFAAGWNAGLRPSPAPTAPLDVERTVRVLAAKVMHHHRRDKVSAANCEVCRGLAARLATPDQRHG